MLIPKQRFKKTHCVMLALYTFAHPPGEGLGMNNAMVPTAAPQNAAWKTYDQLKNMKKENPTQSR